MGTIIPVLLILLMSAIAIISIIDMIKTNRANENKEPLPETLIDESDIPFEIHKGGESIKFQTSTIHEFQAKGRIPRAASIPPNVSYLHADEPSSDTFITDEIILGPSIVEEVFDDAIDIVETIVEDTVIEENIEYSEPETQYESNDNDSSSSDDSSSSSDD